MASSQRHEAGASPWAAQRSRSEPRQQTPMSSVPKFGERCRGILGETPQVRLAPEAEGKMKTLHDTVLLSSSGTCLHVLYLPRLEGKSESVALGSALCNSRGAPGSLSLSHSSSKQRTLYRPQHRSQTLGISLPFGSACRLGWRHSTPCQAGLGSSTGDGQHGL